MRRASPRPFRQEAAKSLRPEALSTKTFGAEIALAVVTESWSLSRVDKWIGRPRDMASVLNSGNPEMMSGAGGCRRLWTREGPTPMRSLYLLCGLATIGLVLATAVSLHAQAATDSNAQTQTTASPPSAVGGQSIPSSPPSVPGSGPAIVPRPALQSVPPSADDVAELRRRLERTEAELAALKQPTTGVIPVSATALNQPLGVEPGDMNTEQRIAALERDASASKAKFPLIRLSGFFQLDDGLFSQSVANRAIVGHHSGRRRLPPRRLQALGNVTEITRYSIEVDFAVVGLTCPHQRHQCLT